MVDIASEALPRSLLRHSECVADLGPAAAFLSCLLNRLPHGFLERGGGSATFGKRFERPRIPVAEGPKPQAAARAVDAKVGRSPSNHESLLRQVFLTEA